MKRCTTAVLTSLAAAALLSVLLPRRGEGVLKNGFGLSQFTLPDERPS
jgi:hypothetical protein